MQKSKWWVIAKNQYLLTTSAIRGIRRYFPYLAIGLMAVYVVFIAPSLVGLFLDEAISILLSQVAVAFVQIILFMIFFIFITFPISNTLREVQSDEMEILLAAPVKASDVLLGEFLGQIPIVAIAITAAVGLFTAILNPIGLDLLQMTIIIIIFIVTFLSAFWIGSVLSVILRTRLGKSARGKDIGRALSVIIVLPFIAIMYAMIGGGILEALADPETNGILNIILGLLPSSWGAETIVSFTSNPGNIAAVGFETLTRLGGLLVFFVATLWLGTKAASRLYTLKPTTLTSSVAKPDGIFYKSVETLGGGGSRGTLLVTAFKDYYRRLENLSWLFYAVGISAMIVIFFNTSPTDPGDTLMASSLFMIPLLTGFVVGTVSRGKEQMMIFKKAPSGIGKFVTARLVQAWIVAVPIGSAMLGVSTLLVPHITIIPLLTNIMWASIRTISVSIIFLGLSLLMPSFSEKARERNLSIMINLQIVIFGTIGLELGFNMSGLSFDNMFQNIEPYTGLLFDHLLRTAILSSVGIVILLLGKRNLSRIE